MKKSTRILAISRKEFFHIIHDPRSLIIIFVLPVLQLIMFGYALNLEIENVDLAVMDHSRSRISRELIEVFDGSKYFRVQYNYGAPSGIEQLFLSRRARVVLQINPRFAEELQKNGSADVQIIIDAADPNAGTIIQNYVTAVMQQFNGKIGKQAVQPFEIRPRVLYNPDMKSAYFFVPGLIAMILIMISALLTSIAITREKETGTLEQILVSPVRPAEIIIGKVVPYIFLAFADGMLILGLGMGLFNVPFAGSVLLLVLLSTLYVVTGLSLGLMISTIVQTQQVAMMIALVATLLPTIMISGFIFPIKSMPWLIQLISYLVPARYFIVIVRGIMLKGNTIMELYPQALPLLLMTAVLLANAIRKFNLNLEK